MKKNNFRKVYHSPVLNCIDAAKERNIKLKQELKTILLKSSSTVIAIHLRACDKVSIRTVKKLFRIKNLTFLPKNYLSQRELSPGLINPWNIPFCQYNLVCRKVLHNKFMATNNQKFTQGVFFNIEVLLELPNLIFGNFSYENKTEYSGSCRFN